MKNTNNISTQFRKGTLDFIILYLLKDKPKYPRELIEKLNNYGFNISEGTIYPLFLRLCKNNLVIYEWKEALGHPRKYYSLTNEGKHTLDNYISEWNKLNDLLKKIT